jgi:hypothetical protein
VAYRRGERFPGTPLEAGRIDGLPPAITAVGDLAPPVLDGVTAYTRRLRRDERVSRTGGGRGRAYGGGLPRPRRRILWRGAARRNRCPVTEVEDTARDEVRHPSTLRADAAYDGARE